MKPLSFKAFLAETSKDNTYQIAQSGVDSKSIANNTTRDLLNAHLARNIDQKFVTPYAAIGTIAKILAYATILIPHTILDSDVSGELVWKVQKPGQTVGPDGNQDWGTHRNDGDGWYVYFAYEQGADGYYKVFCEVVDQETLDALLADDDTEEKEDALGKDIDGDGEAGEDPQHAAFAVRNEGAGERLLKVHKNGPHEAKVYKNYHDGEYRVSFHTNGKHHKDADYHTDDEDDAHQTGYNQAHAMREEPEKVDEKYEGFKKLKGELSHEKGIKNPGALAAKIGMKKWGKKKFEKAAHSGHKLGEEPEKVDEMSPPGMEADVKAMKTKFPKGSSSPWAISWARYHKENPSFKPKSAQ